MKKYLSIILIAILLVSALFILTGCGEDKKQEEKQEENQGAYMPNPLVEVNSLAEMEQKVGFVVPVLDKDVAVYIVIGVDKFEHARINYKDETSFDMAIGKEDISGIYGGTYLKTEKINGVDVKFYTYENQSYAIWTKDNFTYAYRNSKGEVSKDDLEKLIKNDTAQTDKKGYVYEYTNGVLTPIVDEEGNPKQTDFVIDGIILLGNRHAYDDVSDTDSSIENFVKKGYNKTGINSSFYLNEHIEFYIDTKYTGSINNVKILITPHNTVEEYESSNLTELAEEKGAILDYAAPEIDNYKYVGDTYVSMDLPEGKYDILFTYKGKIAYFICIDLAKEPTE